MNVTNLACLKCGRGHRPGVPVYVCAAPGCGGLLEVEYDYAGIAGAVDRDALAADPARTIWRYAPLLPVAAGGPRPPLAVGGTPLYRARRLSTELGIPDLWVKDDGLNPTGSLKDRASAVAVAQALEAGHTTVACASTGNAASSLAGNAASVGLRSVIFVPARAPAGKLTQLLVFGAHVVSVEGSYAEAFSLSEVAIAEHGWYNRNAAINPYLVEGKKTVAYEVAEALGWKAPDWVAVSVGDGCTLAGVYKGFNDLVQLGWLDRMPRLLGVQAEGCAPIYTALKAGRPLVPTAENTLADSIAVGSPRNPDKAMRAIRESHGAMVAVSDADILDSIRLLGRTTGVFGEPAGAAGLAGLRQAYRCGLANPEERAVVLVTGNGLKDIVNGTKAGGGPIRIPPDREALRRALAEAGLD